MPTVHIPSRMDKYGVDCFLSQIFLPNGHLYAENYLFDFKALTFIEPSGVVSLSNAVDFINNTGRKVSFLGINDASQPIRYLDDSGFFKLYLGTPRRSGAGLRSTTVPLQRVEWGNSHFWLDSNFLSWMGRQLGMNARSLSGVKTCLSEIFNNIKDHSGLNIGSIYIQHFPRKHKITICIADFGYGIPFTIRRKFSCFEKDCDAILHASKDAVTSQSVPGNRGAGLDFLIRNVVDIHKGNIYIASGYGKLNCVPHPNGAYRWGDEVSGFYPGTLIEIDLNTGTIVADEEEEDMEW
ncbi:hypothetical protein ABUE34_12890 [Kozakia baliensis]|uniref:hypothetical protein n=1 Tax=Kozakia baliensis TaxID=153496 RepID=UPI00345C1DB0